MIMPIFGFDIDDVCFNSFDIIARRIENKFNRDIKLPTNFDICDQFSDIDPMYIYEEIDKALIDEFSDIKPVDGCLDFLKNYQLNTGEAIHFITSRNPLRNKIREATYALIDMWIPDLRYDISFPKEFGKTKGIICKENKIGIFIEDRVKYCIDVSNHGSLVLMMSRNWNKKYIDQYCFSSIIRIESWKEVYLIFKSFFIMEEIENG